MNFKMKELKITAVGHESDLVELVRFLKTIHEASQIGATRTFKLWVDGDGAGVLFFDFPDARTHQVETKDLDSDLKFYIGG